MSKKVINTTLESQLEPVHKETPTPQSRTVGKLADQVIFSPSAAQARLKAKFWTRFQPGPMMSPDSITLADVQSITNSAAAKKWWSDDGFREWFLNREEERERIKYLFGKSLDSIEQILDNPEANPNAKVNAIKMLAEMNGYLGKKPAERFADEDINKMSEDQLKAFLDRKGVKLVQEKVVDVNRPAQAEGEDSEAEES